MLYHHYNPSYLFSGYNREIFNIQDAVQIQSKIEKLIKEKLSDHLYLYLPHTLPFDLYSLLS